MQSAYQGVLARMVHESYENNDVDPLFADRMPRLAHVIWAVWKDDNEVVHARVILGRELDRPGMVHVAYVVQDEGGRARAGDDGRHHRDGWQRHPPGAGAGRARAYAGIARTGVQRFDGRRLSHLHPRHGQVALASLFDAGAGQTPTAFRPVRVSAVSLSRRRCGRDASLPRGATDCSNHVAPEGFKPLITRRSSTRFLPPVSFGKSGAVLANCPSVSQKRSIGRSRRSRESHPSGPRHPHGSGR